ncbi:MULTISPECIES: transcriptional regulator [Streptomyces]|uniref:Transcriptional regulator n=1 Tax=Streptomyces griseiscabiei TaxID=2993540 RepID=A0ABU4KWR1_9ACTN|nr:MULTISPECIES: transcriptional regulator [Streptomyces]MBZ3900517.1 transcriptional regulator [Streptomyces griseiscabiei]MDX2907832.1 transcriptional regulator [Streptomyces griseiscabiei]
MSALPDSLAETLTRLDARIAEAGADRGRILDVRALAARTALGEDEVRVLLGGDAPVADRVDDRVRGRVRALHEAYAARSGKRGGVVCREVAERLSISPEWARQLLLGKKTPNVSDLTELAGFFGVEEGIRFFTDPAATVLRRELGRAIAELEGDADSRHPDGDGPLVEFATRHGVVTLALRGQRLTRRKQEALAVMLEGLLGADDEEAR